MLHYILNISSTFISKQQIFPCSTYSKICVIIFRCEDLFLILGYIIWYYDSVAIMIVSTMSLENVIMGRGGELKKGIKGREKKWNSRKFGYFFYWIPFPKKIWGLSF